MMNFKDQLQSLPSVAGIVHSAMVLRDEFLKDLTFESFKVVMGPKIKGAMDKWPFLCANTIHGFNIYSIYILVLVGHR